jgi:hypothetical protein
MAWSFATADKFMSVMYIVKYIYYNWGHAVTQLVEALRYKLEVRGFGSR